MGLRAGLRVLHLDDVRTAAGPAREALVNARNLLLGIVAAALIALPFVYRQPYHLHVMVLILIWSFAYTSWSVMGRFGLVSLGHGGFMGVAPTSPRCFGTIWAYRPGSAFRWRCWLPARWPWWWLSLLSLPHHRALFRAGHARALGHRAAGHHRHRDQTGGSLGYTPERTKGSLLVALQFDDKETWYLIALAVWAAGLVIWYWVDRSMMRYAMEAISEDEDAAAAAGINVTAEKLKITSLSAVMTALAGAFIASTRCSSRPIP
jgi:branched-chain amino acid transport system permease protein